MPERSVKSTPPGIQNPFGTYAQMYNKHRLNEGHANPKNDYSVRGGKGKMEKAKKSMGKY